MEECQTPTLAQMVEFKYELTPTMVFDRSRQVDSQNFLANCTNVRCFTPTIKNFQSPGLSPINECPQMLLSGGFGAGVAINVDNFNKFSKEEYFKAPVGKKPKQKVVIQQQQQLIQKQQTQSQQQQKQQQQPQKLQKYHYGTFLSDSPPVFTLNSTTISDNDSTSENSDPESSEVTHGNLKGSNNNNNNNEDNNNDNNSSYKNKNHNNSNNNNSDSSGGSNSSGNLNSSNNKNLSRNNTTNLLNITMNISTLLRSVGLEQYIESFEANIFDLSQFSNLHMEDFPRLGVCKAEHQTIILDLLSKLNGE